MEIFTSTQGPHLIHEIACKVLGVPLNKVVCRTKRLGNNNINKIDKNFNALTCLL